MIPDSGLQTYARKDARVSAVRFAAGADPETYARIMPAGWTATSYDTPDGRTIMRIVGPENDHGERRSFLLNDGDWIVMERGRPWRWPAVLFRFLHSPADDAEGALPDPLNR